MLSWVEYLKKGLSRNLPEDHYNKETKYGRLRDNFKYIFPSVKKEWKLGIISISILIFASLLQYPQPMITKYLIDEVLVKKQIELVIPVVILLAVISLGQYVSGMMKSYYQMRFSQEVILDIQEKLIKKVLSLPKLFFDKNKSGYLMSRIRGDVRGANWFLSGTAVNLFMSSMKFIGGVFFLFYLDWRLALPILLSLPIPFLTIRFFSKRSYIMSHHNNEINAQSNAVLQETVSSVSLIKSFANETKALKNLIGIFRKKVEIGYENQSVGFLSNMINQLLPMVAKLLVTLFGAYWIIDGQWEIGTLIAYQAYLMYVYGPVNQLSNSINSLQSARATLDRMATMFELDPEENIDTGIKIENINGDIKFDKVTFYYEKNNPVLNNLSFEIKKGENWAIIGSSGVGKSTLINLILRFYKTLEGNIYIDNYNLNEINIRTYRRKIGYVSQKHYIQSGSIKDNLKYGNKEASEDDIIKACKIAEIHNFIMELPDGYDSNIEENAENLSEGQKQRISIARALVSNPDLLIFDEPTSSLDNKTERSIYQSLPESIRGKTTITIAHRISTIKSANKILLLRKDKPPVIGTYSEIKKHPDFIEFIDED